MPEENESAPVSPAVKVAIALAVALFIAILAQAFGGDGDEVVDDPPTSTVPGTLAFEEESTGESGTPASDDGGVETEVPSDGGDAAVAPRPTIVESIELNPRVTLDPTTTTVPGHTSTTSDIAEETSTTTEDPGGDVDPDDTIPPQFDENGDPIPVPDDEQPTENEPVRRTYNDYDGGSS